MHVIVSVQITVVRVVKILVQDVKIYATLVVRVNAMPYVQIHVKTIARLVVLHPVRTYVKTIVMLAAVTVLNKGGL